MSPQHTRSSTATSFNDIARNRQRRSGQDRRSARLSLRRHRIRAKRGNAGWRGKPRWLRYDAERRERARQGRRVRDQPAIRTRVAKRRRIGTIMVRGMPSVGNLGRLMSVMRVMLDI